MANVVMMYCIARVSSHLNIQDVGMLNLNVFTHIGIWACIHLPGKSWILMDLKSEALIPWVLLGLTSHIHAYMQTFFKTQVSK